MTAARVKALLKASADPDKAAFFPKFFKTGPGQYGEGDRFLGVSVPQCRAIAKQARGMELAEVSKLMSSPIHEEREVALFVLVDAFNRAASENERAEVYRFYVRYRARVNSWDLVDGSAPTIVGGYLEDKNRKPLYRWAKSTDLWERRIAMLATFHFIKKKDFKDALAIAKLLRDDEHDLIHKAVGWMLREVGNRDLALQERFLKTHYKKMPRTMLRYAIEKFPEKKRQAYLKGAA
jgi:3-methyladenine DNA glycosylase AlkD